MAAFKMLAPRGWDRQTDDLKSSLRVTMSQVLAAHSRSDVLLCPIASKRGSEELTSGV